MSIVNRHGAETAPRPRADRPRSPVVPSIRTLRRNDVIFALSLLGLASPQIAAYLTAAFGRTLDPGSVRRGLREARARREAQGAGLLTAWALLDTPLTDDPEGPRYGHDPGARAWVEEHYGRDPSYAAWIEQYGREDFT